MYACMRTMPARRVRVRWMLLPGGEHGGGGGGGGKDGECSVLLLYLAESTGSTGLGMCYRALPLLSDLSMHVG